jgi:fermentation-respiration switch protein FrsA (DUF1100 family)
MKALGGQFALPVFVIQGAEDFTTPTPLARELVASLRAPHKEFVTIRGGGHFAVFMKTDEFLKELFDRVRPLATENGDLRAAHDWRRSLRESVVARETARTPDR